MDYLQMRSNLSNLTVLLTAQVLFSVSAFGAGFQINELSTSLFGNAMAGAAAAKDDVSSLFINPATLSTLTNKQIYVGASEIFANGKMPYAAAIHTVNTPGTPPSNTTALVTGRSSQGNIFPHPAFVPDSYFGWRINDRIVAGIALVAPYGLVTQYHRDSVLRFAAKRSFVKTIDVNPVLSFALDEKWTIGVGIQAQYIKTVLSNFNGPYTGEPDIDALIVANHPTTLTGKSWGYGYTLGLLFTPNPCARFGVGYRSQISEHLNGHGAQFTSPGNIVPAPAAEFLFNARSAVHAKTRTPAILTLGIAQDIYNLTLKASAQINFWHNFKKLTINMPNAFATRASIPARWKNTWFASLGADYRFPSQWIVRGGIAFDQTPTRDRFRDPRIPDSHRYWLNLGGTYVMNPNISFDGTYSHIFFLNGKVRVTQALGSSATSTLPLEVNHLYARYKSSADIVSLAFRYSF